ncbi:hypothetical protein DL240_11875 [Lujinxingia litoralis]|uniref:Uncharacterized protein n=1 Tax=Lujinxingia litoralis TaxID=2211119 RepID=A0A328C495_9DELT|nr:hypothetical protein [Lujinxingia litoralis]RAL21549.1 hypothetical protein DL240_11875 [Lujinxingia litoralis]
MSDTEEYFISHRERLQAHLDEFTPRQRARIAEFYGLEHDAPEFIAQAWLADPENVVERVLDEVTSPMALRLLEELVLEHDIGLSIGWAPSRHRQLLGRLGLIKSRRDERGEYYAVVPGAIAAILAPEIDGQRPSLLLLLGRAGEDALARLEAKYRLEPTGSRAERVIDLAEAFEQPETVNDMIEALPNPDWIGDAMMVLELGGVCYWQQIYGYDIDPTFGQAPDDKVVPLMRSQDRQYQQDVAEHLLEAGILFRFDDPVIGVPMVAVPEELWRELWTLGRRWLLDWMAQAYFDLSEQGARRASVESATELQAVLKWLALEREESPLSVDEEGQLDAKSRSRLNALSEREVPWLAVVSLAREARIFEVREGQLEQGVEFEAMLNAPRRRFARELLLEWSMGYSGARADVLLAEAIGLDEAWRARAVGLLREHGEMVPAWMQSHGVPSQETGGGWLRAPEEGSDEAVLFEAGLVFAFVLAIKVTWLDLLSLLAADHWYTLDGMVELMQCTAAASMFSQLGMVLEHQNTTVYLPYQRASFFMDAYHGPKFREWLEQVLDELLVPLGVVRRSEGGDLVQLDTRQLRVDSPPGWPPGHRRQMLVEILGDEDLHFEPPSPGAPELRPVSLVTEEEPTRVSLAEPLAALRGLVGDRRVERFDGRFLKLSGEGAD